jgi:hypothetical protein
MKSIFAKACSVLERSDIHDRMTSTSPAVRDIREQTFEDPGCHKEGTGDIVAAAARGRRPKAYVATE